MHLLNLQCVGLPMSNQYYWPAEAQRQHMRKTKLERELCNFGSLSKQFEEVFFKKYDYSSPLTTENLTIKMALDVNVCLKALSASFCQYRSHTTDTSVKDLERQIDVSNWKFCDCLQIMNCVPA